MGGGRAPYEAALTPVDRAVDKYAKQPTFVTATLVAQWIGIDPEVVLAADPAQWVRRLAQAKVVAENWDKTPRGRTGLG